MRNFLTKATLGLTLGATALTVAAPAEAQRYRNYRHRDNTGTALVAGVAGLAIGAALASNRDRRYGYDRGYYDRGYNYDRGYYRDRGYYNDGYYSRNYYRPYRGYGRGYGRCDVRRVYDPYIGRSVRVRYC